jgi:ABC-2 type transport system ATP-binding protein
MPGIELEETAPRFEDAFIDLLGGAGTAESPLGAMTITTLSMRIVCWRCVTAS